MKTITFHYDDEEKAHHEMADYLERRGYLVEEPPRERKYVTMRQFRESLPFEIKAPTLCVWLKKDDCPPFHRVIGHEQRIKKLIPSKKLIEWLTKRKAEDNKCHANKTTND